MKRCFEFNDEVSHKFWEIDLVDSTVTTYWGKIGNSAQKKSKVFGDEEKARLEYDKLVKEKTGKGYLEVGATGSINAGVSTIEGGVSETGCTGDAYIEILNCVKDWLLKNDPHYHDCTNAKVSDADLKALASQVGKKLPHQYIQLYKHMGTITQTFRCPCQEDPEAEIPEEQMSDFFGGSFFIPLAGVDGVLGEHAGFEEYQDSLESYVGSIKCIGPIKRMSFNPLWVPFAKDYGGNYVGIDLDPARNGKIGQVIKFGRDEDPTVLAVDLFSFFLATYKKHVETLSATLELEDRKYSEESRQAKIKESIVEPEVIAFSKVSGVAKKVLREPYLLEPALTFLSEQLGSKRLATRVKTIDEIGTIASEVSYMLDDVEPRRATAIRALLSTCGQQICECLRVTEEKSEIEEALRSIAALRYEDIYALHGQ